MMEKQISKKKLERLTIHGGDFRYEREKGVMCCLRVCVYACVCICMSQLVTIAGVYIYSC